ncbi:MAG: GHMP kinase [Acidobacteriia bacterium]|nr:GHMP kinase [Terriglobia bacterium]
MPSQNDRRAVLAKAPCRADLAGATIDLWPLYLFHPGSVTVNFAVSVMTTCRITPLAGKAIQLKSLDTGREERFADLEALCRAPKYAHPLAARLLQFFQPEGGLALETTSESPAGAGIAGSSALMIAATGALARYTGRRIGREQMRVLAQNVEAQLINVPTGCQDYYPALYGGVSAIHLDTDQVRREALPVAPEEIEARFLLVYTGAPRASGINNWEVFKAHIDGDRKVVRNFERMAQISRAMHGALSHGDWDEVARLLLDEWKFRKSNYAGISTPLIDNLVAVAAKNGGRAAKVCGAGGGGCVVFMVREDAKQRVAEALRQAGGRVLPFRVASDGLVISAVNTETKQPHLPSAGRSGAPSPRGRA